MLAEFPTVFSANGKRGTLHLGEAAAGRVVVRFGERRFVIPVKWLTLEADGSYSLPYSVADPPIKVNILAEDIPAEEAANMGA